MEVAMGSKDELTDGNVMFVLVTVEREVSSSSILFFYNNVMCV